MGDRVVIGIVALGLAALAALPLACETRLDSAPDGKAAAADVAGTYTLVTVDGHAIPYAPMHQGQRAPTIVSSTLTLDEGGRFESKMSYGKPDGGEFSRDFKGTYVRKGSELVMTWEGAGRTTVTIDGGTLTMNNEGMLFVYEK